jgi:hypothetical protein
MDRNRLLELAIKELEKQKAAVDAEIEDIRSELRGVGATRPTRPVVAVVGGRRRRTPAERKAQSEKMRKIWAARKAAALTNKAPAKPKADKAVVSKSRSEAMKAAWAKRKAQKTVKTAKTKPAPKPAK